MPIETVKSIKLNSTSNELVTEGELNLFKVDNSYNFYLDKTQKLETSIGLSSFSLSSISNSGIFQNNSNYHDDYFFDSYDNYYNLLQYHKQDDNNISTIWGYDNTYPIIKAENVNDEDLNTAVNSSTNDITALLNTIMDLITTGQKNAWTSFNTNLRNHILLRNARVTTYTYKPLVGITSSTDPAGIATYYEYDPFGRLSVIRDAESKIIKKYDYHYAGQEGKK